MKIHNKKLIQPYFDDVWNGNKTFEIRKNDCDYQIGDFLILHELTNETIQIEGKKLYRIKALIDFGDVKAGDLGGFIEKESNLSHLGSAWIYDDAKVYGNAEVYGNAWIYDDAEVCGNARVCDDAMVCGNAMVCDDGDYACVKGFGTEYRNTTFYKQKNGSVGVNCGCFTGTLGEFRNQVKKTRKGKIEKEYLMIADLIEYHFAEEGEGL